MKMKNKLVIILTFIIGKALGCTCTPPPAWDESYLNSEHIIIGKAIDDNIIEVIEVFKGNHLIEDVIHMGVTSNCESTIQKNKIALLFLKGDHQLGCFPNQVIDNMQYIRPLPPQSTSHDGQELNWEINSLKNDLHFQNYITWLRTKRQNSNYQKLRGSINQLNHEIHSIKTSAFDNKILLYSLIGMNFLLIYLVVSIKYKKHR